MGAGAGEGVGPGTGAGVYIRKLVYREVTFTATYSGNLWNSSTYSD